MHSWLNLGFTPPDLLRPLAVAAEEEGYHGVTLPEHLVSPERVETPNPYVVGGGSGFTPDTPFADPWVVIAALSSVTGRLRFMTNVYVLALRDVLVVARSLASAAVMSEDRVDLGVGVGWLREEFAAARADFSTRGARTDEMLEVLPRLLTGEPVAHRGRFFSFDAVRVVPAPARRVPVLVGGTSDAALARAARHDGWVGVNFELEVLAPVLERLAAARRSTGEARGDHRIVVSTPPGADRSTIEALAALGVTDLVHRPTVFAAGAGANLDAHRDAMRRSLDLVRE